MRKGFNSPLVHQKAHDFFEYALVLSNGLARISIMK